MHRKSLIWVPSAILLTSACSERTPAPVPAPVPESSPSAVADRTSPRPPRCYLEDERGPAAVDLIHPLVKRPDLTGLTVAEVTAQETRKGHTIRILSDDGVCRGRRSDLSFSRVNLYLDEGKVRFALMF